MSHQPKDSGGLGQWEEHTKGFGSKMLKKMGLKPGQGLGKNNEGILEPIKIQANKGRSTLGSARNYINDDREVKKSKYDKSSDEDDDDRSDASDTERSPMFVKGQDKEDQEDNDSFKHISKQLLASNKKLISDWKLKLSEEISNQSLLIKAMEDLQNDLKADIAMLDDCRGSLDIIKHLETINRNDKLDLPSFWSALPTSICPTTRCLLIQVFAIPLLVKNYRILMLQSRPGPIEPTILEELVFPDIIRVAIEWLRTKQYYSQIVDWYLEWMVRLTEIMHVDRVKHFRRRLLDVMYLATLDNHRDLNSFRYIKYDEWKISRSDNEVKPSQAPNFKTQELLSLKALVEETALERGYLFRPVEGRSHESKQVYKFEKLNIYIDNMVIFVRKNSRWLPMNLDDVISMNR